jgi:regulatory protein
LLQAGHEKREVEAAIRRLREDRYLDDAAFAARFARSRLAAHGLGRRRVQQGLRARGVSRDHTEQGLGEALQEVSEAEALDAMARRYWTQHVRDEPRRRLRKLWAFLLRRGYAGSLVRARLAALWPRWQDALDGLEPEETETDGEGRSGEQ